MEDPSCHFPLWMASSSPSSLLRGCWACGRPASQRCSGCHVAIYCDRECQRQHWVACHKKECKALQQSTTTEPVAIRRVLDESVLTLAGDPHLPYMRLARVAGVGRTFLATQDLEPGTTVLEDPPYAVAWYKDCPVAKGEEAKRTVECAVRIVLGMVNRIVRGELRCEEVEQLYPPEDLSRQLDEDDADACTASHVVRQVLGSHASDLGPRRLSRLYHIVNLNNFTLFSEDGTCLGMGLFPTGSYFNHSCDPTCVYFFDTRRELFVVRTKRCVRTGEELTVSYLPSDTLMEPTSIRRDLLRCHNFVCHCPRCGDE